MTRQNTREQDQWRLSRAGLINFWYYDDEEFHFADGRLLLRGANGSGKSVTMQSLITVLLDGVKTPDRLDSFGSRSRRMEDYLLGEKELVNRDERTGYLYLEYKRRASAQYLTTGIGLQARRGSSLDFWGFVITDNRRIRHDLLLYKEEINPLDGTVERVPLTRAELERAIGPGGQVVRSQKEYMELVNRHIFGFASLEQYEELMKLLIQLRSPKLSKDFKPSVIYDILNEALPPLSDEELRPLSETIESMQRTKDQIEQLERDKQALGRLCRNYDLYNTYVLAEKADLTHKAERRLAKLQREREELRQRLAEDGRQLAEARQRREELKREEAVLAREREELQQHDAFRAQQQKQQHETQLNQVTALQRDKAAKLAEKQRRERQEQQKLRDYEARAEECRGRQEELLQDMDDAAGQAAFAEHKTLAGALAQENAAFSFAAWRRAAGSYTGRLSEVLGLLRRQAELQLRRQEIDKELGEERRVLDEFRAEYRRLELQFGEARDQLLADLYHWRQQHGRWLPLEQDELRDAAQAIQGLYETRSWPDVEAPLAAAYGRRVQAINQELGLINAELRGLEEEEQELTAALNDWRARRDPEPPRLSDAQAARALLTDRNIPFLPLYAAVEFNADVPPDVRERIEAALTDMGLLDALIVPRQRRQDIPQDIYGAVIQPAPQIMAVTLADYLHPTPVDGVAVTAADIDDVLRSIIVEDVKLWGEAAEDSAGAALAANGAYRIGPVAGKAPRRQAATFIGRQAREAYRRQQIAALEEQLAALALKQEALYGRAAGLQEALERASQAKANFPADTALRVLHHEKLAVAANISRQEQAVERVDARLRAVVRDLQELRGALAQASAGIALPLREGDYAAAVQAMADYQASLHELELCCQDYANLTANARRCREFLADIRQEVDDLKGELLVLDGQATQLRLTIAHLESRLQELGADELKARIQNVAKRLEEIPAETAVVIETIAMLQANIDGGERRLAQLAESCAFLDQVCRCWQQTVDEELKLGLVYPVDGAGPTVAAIIQEKGAILKQDRLNRTTVTGRLSESFYAENNVLMEYRMQLEPVAAEPHGLPELPANIDDSDELAGELERLCEKRQRLVITLDYDGRRLNPYQLREALDRQLDTLRLVLSEKDKELYEEVILNNIGRLINRRISAAEQWVEDMNRLMRQRDTSSGLRFKLEWKARPAEQDDELDTEDLVRLLHADPTALRDDDLSKIERHFKARIERAKQASDGGTQGAESATTFQQAVREVLDYRRWFQFRLYYEQAGLTWRELTDRAFFRFSGGEKAMAMYIPLFSAVYSRYQEARYDAPYIITLDEAFAGVDENNIRDMFALVEQLGFNYIMNSQALWGDYDVVPALAVYELVRPKNSPYVTVVHYYWNGQARTLAATGEDESGLFEVAAATQTD